MQGLVENQPQFNLDVLEVGQAFEVNTLYPGRPVDIADVVSDYVRIEVLK